MRSLCMWRNRRTTLVGLSQWLAACAITVTSGAAQPPLSIGARAWRIVERESGPTNYYSVVTEGGTTFLRARYVPPMKTALLGWQVPERDRRAIKKLRWSWRARTLPEGADECTSGKGDSAAVVYVTWKRGLRYYTLKYVWTTPAATKGRICGRKRNPFVAQDTVIVEAGAPLDTWRGVEIDLSSEFRSHFEGGDPRAEVPNLIGIGIMSDGDQTQSKSSADFGTFTLFR